MSLVYPGKYTFPVASTAERSMQQGAAAQAQMYAGLGQTLGKTFGAAIGKYFDVQDEKKAAESMAENRFALDIIYQGRDVPADREQRIKDARGVMKASGGFKNFLGRIETERANQRADRAEALNQLTAERMLEVHKQNVALGKQTAALRSYQIEAAEDDQTTREATQEFEKFLTTPRPTDTLSKEGQRRRELFTKQEKFIRQGELPEDAGKQLEREERYSRILAPHKVRPPSDMTSEELSRYIEEGDLSSEAKIAGLKKVEQLKAQEMAALKFNVELGALGLAGHKSREELAQLFRKPVNALRADFTKEKPVQELDVVKVSFDKVRQSAATATPAGDVQLIFSFMKVLDPGSIVRESEFEQAGNTGGLPVRIQNWYDKLVKGTGLQQPQRDELVKQAKIAATAQLKATGGKIDFYKKLAETRGIPIEQIIPKDTLDLFEKGFPGTLETAGTPGSDGSTIVGNFEVRRGGQPTAAAPALPTVPPASPGGRTPTIEELIEQVDAQNVPPAAPPLPTTSQDKVFGAPTASKAVERWIRDGVIWYEVETYFNNPSAGRERRARWEADYGEPFDLSIIRERWDAGGGRPD